MESGADEPIDFIELDDEGGAKRQLTKKQIKSTLDRYRDLNYKWQDMKPVADIVSTLLGEAEKKGIKGTSKDVADLIKASITAYLSNPTLGHQKDGVQSKETGPAKGEMSPPGDDNWEETLSSWEKENAVALPPGYKDSMKSSKELNSKVDRLMNLVQTAMQSANMGQQAISGAQSVAQQAAQTQMSATQTSIKNNLTQAAMAAQVDPSAQQDFLVFAMQRGYTPEDFIDPELASVVMQDYKANKDAPEINRLRSIAQRRQAFTGMVEGAPGGAAAAPAPGGDPMLQSLIGKAMQSRNLG